MSARKYLELFQYLARAATEARTRSCRAEARLLARLRGRKARVFRRVPVVVDLDEKISRRIQAMIERTFLDWNATAPLRPQSRDAMIAALTSYGNPSSVHVEG